jgi:hypothetical protein
MMQFFKKSMVGAMDMVNSTVDELTPLDTPIPQLPRITDDCPGSIGIDCNLPLLVKDIGTLKIAFLTKRKDELTKELEKINSELKQLDVLLTAVQSL